MIIQFPDRRRSSDKGKAVIKYDRPYLSTEEVAQLFGFSVRTITMWAVAWQESGGTQGIPAFKMGRSWRFDRQQVEALVRSKQFPFQQTTRNTACA